jgi:hypothetical protein
MGFSPCAAETVTGYFSWCIEPLSVRQVRVESERFPSLNPCVVPELVPGDEGAVDARLRAEVGEALTRILGWSPSSRKACDRGQRIWLRTVLAGYDCVHDVIGNVCPKRDRAAVEEHIST